MNINRIYPSGRVRRFHTTDLPGQTVGHHSWGVALIVADIYPRGRGYTEIPSRLLLSALTHDCAEVMIGDVPSPIQREYPELAQVLKGIERRFNLAYDIEFELTEKERAILKWADMFECLLFAQHCVSMGMRPASEVRTRAKEYLDQLGFPTNESKELYYAIFSE